MLKTFPIDFVRQILEQKLLEEHINNVNYFGGKEQVAITSFYEQLKSQDEVDRFIETYRDLTEQQNRTGLILNGVLLSPENPTITNLYSSLIVPMAWTTSLRCTLENRDNAIITINNLIEKLKGRKVDVAQLNCVDEDGRPYSTPFCVGIIGQNSGAPALKDGDYIGTLTNANAASTRISEYISKGVTFDNIKDNWFYCQHSNKLKVVRPFITTNNIIDWVIYDSAELVGNRTITILCGSSSTHSIIDYGEIIGELTISDFGGNDTTIELKNGKITELTVDGLGQTSILVQFTLDRDIQDYVSDYGGFNVENVVCYELIFQFIEDDGTYKDIIFPPEHTSFEKYKVSLSFDAIRCDEPRNLNEKEYCELSFGGSATLVSKGVQLGNDLLKIGITKLGYQAESYVSFSNAPTYLLEPLEMPSGNNANTQINQLLANNFVSNTHTDAIALTLQYTFICDIDIDLINQWFNYARYGTRGLTVNDITPNLEYKVVEYWCSWGDFESKEIKTKIIENIDIENTESDALTLSLTMQIQGENN